MEITIIAFWESVISLLTKVYCCSTVSISYYNNTGENEMNYRNKLLLFNSHVLLNKREVIDSFDDFIIHHKEQENEEGYCEGKRRVLIALCNQFRSLLIEKDIPSLTKHWMYYDYSITNDSIVLSLLKCGDVEFDENDEISSMTSTEEYTIAEVICDYVTVEQFAKQCEVTATTVRQWIRRGKLRAAKKAGRDWLIPALADKPTRGFNDVTYLWKLLPQDIIDTFPLLSDCDRAYIYQNEHDKSVYHCITNRQDKTNMRQDTELTGKEREKLELALISTPGVIAEDIQTQIWFSPRKKASSLPVLHSEKEDCGQYLFSDIVVHRYGEDTVVFSPASEVGSFMHQEYPAPYLLPVAWDFWGIPHGSDDSVYEVIDENDYSKCVHVGNLSGYIIDCENMILEGYNPVEVCDDESGDLLCIISILSSEGGPLDETMGDPMQNVFYIHEIIIDEPLRRKGLGTRILQEIPYLCKSLEKSFPDILAYYIAIDNKLKEDLEKNSAAILSTEAFRFYNSNGFFPLGDDRMLYTFIDA